MAEGGRKSLVWDIRRSLLTLLAGELYKVAKKVGPAGPGQPDLDATHQEGCHISSFMYSKPLLEAEDGGMVDLLMLKDFIDDVIENRQVCDDSEDVDSPVTQTVTQTVQPACPSGGMGDSPTQPVPMTTIANMVNRPPVAGTTSPTGLASSIPDITNAELQEMLNSYEELGKRLRQRVMVPTEQSPRQPTDLLVQANLTQSDPLQPNPPGQSRAQPTREGMISLRDLSYLLRREFRVQGGQVGDHSSNISYNNICKQMDEGIREGFPDTDIVRGVLRIIKPGTFKDMLINKDDLTVVELKGFLQAHLREKNGTELFQELMCARQDESETPQQFLYRVIGLKHSDIRRELKPLLSSGEVSDETILCHIMRITSEESERQKRIGSSCRQNTTSAHSAQSELNTIQECSKQDRPIDTTKTDPIKELTAKVNELAGLVEAMRQQTLARPSDLANPYSQNRSRNRKDKTFGCPNGLEQNRPDCRHCFICGEEGHRAVGCLKKSKNQGNVNRSLQRGAQ
ncbi:hypothetical protein ACER0C_015018 [Sarotherodon galilaeus]